MKDFTLVILAAGMGSRYGGTKQLDGISEHGETIMDFSLFDAIKAGFTKVVFIVRKDILEEVKTDFGAKLKDKVEVEYAIQETSKVPEKYSNNQRVKPWGTAHALLVAKDIIKDNFCVINADDFYGLDAFETIISFLKNADETSTDYAMIGYPIYNTLSDNGSVSRGETFADENNNLQQIIERTAITKRGEEIVFENEEGKEAIMSRDTIVSMNFFGFTPTFLDFLDREFEVFLEESSQELKAEFFLPLVVDNLIKTNEAQVKVLSTDAKWMGVTYKEDKEIVVNKVKDLIAQAVYPPKLW
ncbi:Bifunctional protein GlmU [Polaribacter huanghezhanensis]|uniref:sugar phosphate nucleotidyltransferase n=1 Tax=Polaribacter huanghezhanensis TaxID=1354726 RepID=UPI0026481DAD|nr:sugar phosphate nucleotidyltransferase [Polaribacter huanghezhanensis]WKD84728.1 Bifunctional protein GlmU [Polaribacter huanghezhanensis]